MLKNTKKVVVVYTSKYGSTKRYAEWIANDVNGDLFESSMVKVDDLLKYDTIVFGGSLHAVGIKGIKLITDNFNQLKDRRIIVFGIGASTVRSEVIQHVLDHNFTEEIKQKINFFYMRGAFNYNKLSFVDKTLMYMLKIKLQMKKKEELDEDSRGLLDCYAKPNDWADKKAIIPIVECIDRRK